MSKLLPPQAMSSGQCLQGGCGSPLRASPNVPRQMHHAAAEEGSASLSVKGRGVGAYISSPWWGRLQIFWRATSHPLIPYVPYKTILTIRHKTTQIQTSAPATEMKWCRDVKEDYWPWLLLVPVGYCWLLLVTVGYCWLLLVTVCYCWLLLVAQPEAFSLLMKHPRNYC